MTDKEKKLHKLGKIYGAAMNTKQNRMNNRMKDKKKILKNEKLFKDDEGIKLKKMFETASLEREGEKNGDKAERKISLPALTSNGLESQSKSYDAMAGTERKISLPIINTRIKSTDKNVSLKGSVDCENQMEKCNDIKENDKLELKSKIKDSVNETSKCIPERQENRGSVVDMIDLMELIKKLDGKKPRKNNGFAADEKTYKEMLRYAARTMGKATMFTKSIMEDLNIQYIYSSYHDTDYNDKYDRFLTPDIETDEEKEIDIIHDMQKRNSQSRGKSQSEISISSDGESEAGESNSDVLETEFENTDELSSASSDIVSFYSVFHFFPF